MQNTNENVRCEINRDSGNRHSSTHSKFGISPIFIIPLLLHDVLVVVLHRYFSTVVSLRVAESEVFLVSEV